MLNGTPSLLTSVELKLFFFSIACVYWYFAFHIGILGIDTTS